MKDNNDFDSVLSFLLAHKACNPVSFHMPGHKGSRLYKRFGYSEFLDCIADCDITEICGADNLFQPEDIIAQTMERYGKMYEVRKSYMLVNGSSCGLIAAMTAAVPPNKKIIMARNCHKSIFNGLNLGGISPVYIYPQLIEKFGISGEINPQDVKKALEEEKEVEAVIIPSPNYYGICSDIEEIARITHSFGKILIVDQAHGAHLKLFGKFLKHDSYKEQSFESGRVLPRSAEECGADIVISSTHKTLASFTQSAIMNVVSENIDLRALEDKLQALESTSPSYLLMASMDISLQMLENHGNELMCEWYENLVDFYKKAENIRGLNIVDTGSNMDWTKINLDMSECGLSGYELEELLMKNNIFAELVTGNIVMCMSGIGNTRSDFDKLLAVLENISGKFADIASDRGEGKAVSNVKREADKHKSSEKIAELSRLANKKAELCEIPREKEYIHIKEAVGRVAAASIIPYPPGIPMICPGEKIEAEKAEYAAALKKAGEKVIGVSEDMTVAVGKNID